MTLTTPAGTDGGAAARPMVKALFVSTCLLSIVSWYTTYVGMALYLSPWFAFLASLGIQSALVLVAWLIGFQRGSRSLLTVVYGITAVVSVAFSYVSLYTWFSTKERPALVERKLYDTISTSASQSEQYLTDAIAARRKHVTALEEMTIAEKAHGFISRAEDSDPYLQSVREAVAREARTYGDSYKEGSGTGLRYTAFERYAKLAKQSLEQMNTAQRALVDFKAQVKPSDPSEQQIRRYREVYDGIPWSEVAGALAPRKIERPPVPDLGDHVDRTATGQEDMLLAFTELVTAPTGRHLFAFLLAAFIDIVVFLLAYAAGPYFAGPPEQRWCLAGASLDGVDSQVFVRDLLSKIKPDGRAMARVEVDGLTPGEHQFLMLLASKNKAALFDDAGHPVYLLDDTVHEQLVDTLATTRGMPLRAAGAARRASV